MPEATEVIERSNIPPIERLRFHVQSASLLLSAAVQNLEAAAQLGAELEPVELDRNTVRVLLAAKEISRSIRELVAGQSERLGKPRGLPNSAAELLERAVKRQARVEGKVGSGISKGELDKARRYVDPTVSSLLDQDGGR